MVGGLVRPSRAALLHRRASSAGEPFPWFLLRCCRPCYMQRHFRVPTSRTIVCGASRIHNSAEFAQDPKKRHRPHLPWLLTGHPFFQLPNYYKIMNQFSRPSCVKEYDQYHASIKLYALFCSLARARLERACIKTGTRPIRYGAFFFYLTQLQRDELLDCLSIRIFAQFNDISMTAFISCV